MAEFSPQEIKEILDSGSDELLRTEDMSVPQPQLEDLGFADKYFLGKAKEFPDLPNSIWSTEYTDMIYNDEIPDSAHGAVTAAYALDFDDKDVIETMKQRIPNISFTQDRFQNVIGSIPKEDGSNYRFYVNPIGIQGPDLIRFGGQLLQYLPVEKVTRIQKTAEGFTQKKYLDILPVNSLIARSGKGSLTALGIGSAQDIALNELTGGQKQGLANTPIDGEKAVMNSLGTIGGIAVSDFITGPYINKAYTGLKNHYKNMFPVYYDRKSGLPTPRADSLLTKAEDGFTIQNIRNDDGVFEKFYVDSKGRKYSPDDDFIGDTVKFLESGEDIDTAILLAKGKKMGVPLFSAQTGSPQERALMITTLSGGFGQENKEIAEQLLELQQERAVRSLATTLGITGKSQDDFVRSYRGTSENDANKKLINNMIGTNLEKLVKNSESVLGARFSRRYKALDQLSLKIKREPLEELKSNLVQMFRANHNKNWDDDGIEFVKNNAKGEHDYLNIAFNKIDQLIEQDNRKITPQALKVIRRLRNELFDKADKADPVDRARVMSYQTELSNYVDSISETILTTNRNKIENFDEVFKEVQQIKKDYKEFAELTGRPKLKTNTFGRRDRDDTNLSFIADLLEGRYTPEQIGNYVTNSANNKITQRGLYNDFLNIEKLIKMEYKDNPQLGIKKLTQLKDDIKQAVHNTIAYESVVKSGAGVDVSANLLQNALVKWKLGNNKETWDWIHNGQGDEILDSLNEFAINSNIRNSIYDNSGAGFIARGNRLTEKESGAIKNILQFQAYRYGQLEGLYGFKAVSDIVSQGKDDVGLALKNAFETNPTGRVGQVTDIMEGRGSSPFPVVGGMSPMSSDVNRTGIPLAGPENIDLPQSELTDDELEDYLKNLGVEQ